MGFEMGALAYDLIKLASMPNPPSRLLGHEDWSPYARLIFDRHVLHKATEFENKVTKAVREGINPMVLARD